MSDQQEVKEPQEVEEHKEGYGSIERGIAGQFEFSISAVINEAWERTKGNKGKIWLGFVIFFVIYMIATIIINSVQKVIGLPVPPIPAFSFSYIFPAFIVSPILLAALTIPLTVGLWMLGVKIATDQPCEPTEVLQYFPKLVNLFLTYITMYILIVIGFCLFILPGIYLSVAYYLALPLVAEKNLSVWQALETSRKAVNHIWFSLFGLFLVLALLCMATIFTLGIGLIWVLPLMMISYGIVYRIVFGIESSVTVDA